MVVVVAADFFTPILSFGTLSVVEKIYDECINWITFNHISASPAYVDIKAEKIVDLIHKYAHLEEFKTKEFDDLIKDDVRNCIEKLMTIRKVYK